MAEKDGAYQIRERDISNPNVVVRCICPFDLYCEIPDVEQGAVTILLEDKSYSLEISAGSGEIFLITRDTHDVSIK